VVYTVRDGRVTRLGIHPDLATALHSAGLAEEYEVPQV
jgi:hypothetical protein